MSNKFPNQFSSEMSDDNEPFLGDTENSLAIMEPEPDAPENADDSSGLRCANCGAPSQAASVTVCPSCGWYERLGRCVEVDPDWEVMQEADAAIGGEGAAPQLSHLGVWMNLLPAWAWIILASAAAVVVESVVAVVVTPAEIGGWRTKWSLIQLTVGSLVFIGCHFLNYLLHILEDSEVGLMDVLLRPLRLWMRTCHQLPARLWLVDSAVCGFTAAMMSILVIGALPYDRLWDWGFKAPVKHNLMGAVMDRAKKLEGRGSDNLEDAISDFAGKAGVEDVNDMPKAKPAAPRLKADCVILGYQLDRDGRLEYLILGTSHLKKLVYAGKVNPEIGDEERSKLLTQLSAIQVRDPFIRLASDTAKWVQPKYACRVTYTERMKGGQLRDIKWDTLLGSIRRD
jgi:hypothetical protein